MGIVAQPASGSERTNPQCIPYSQFNKHLPTIRKLSVLLQLFYLSLQVTIISQNSISSFYPLTCHHSFTNLETLPKMKAHHASHIHQVLVYLDSLLTVFRLIVLIYLWESGDPSSGKYPPTLGTFTHLYTCCDQTCGDILVRKYILLEFCQYSTGPGRRISMIKFTRVPSTTNMHVVLASFKCHLRGFAGDQKGSRQGFIRE